jgi:hypothetical protein
MNKSELNLVSDHSEDFGPVLTSLTVSPSVLVTLAADEFLMPDDAL